MAVRPDLRKNVYLIGDLDSQIHGNKLPSKEQVLKVLIYNIREKKLNVRESAKLVLNEVKSFWDKARLPIQQESRCIEKVSALHQTWSNLQKNAGRPFNLKKEQNFCSDIKNLFDIAHGNILQQIDDRRREFLENQRRDGRVGNIDNIKSFFDKKEEEERYSKEVLSRRLARSQMDVQLLGKI